jgi:hypothetical protein
MISDRSDIESPPGSADRPIDRVSLPTRPTRRRTPLQHHVHPLEERAGALHATDASEGRIAPTAALVAAVRAPDPVLVHCVQGQVAQTGVLGGANVVLGVGSAAVAQFEVGELAARAT